MKTNRVAAVLIILLAVVLLAFTGCSKEEEAKVEEKAAVESEAADEPFKAAFVYIGIPGDLGWTYEHDRGRLAAVEALGDKIETAFVENVPEGPDATRVIRQLAQQGYKIIFTASFGYMDPTLEVAAEYPDVYFEHCSGYKTADNMANYFGRIYQSRYLSGIVAGAATKTGVIGYVGAFPIPEVVRGINAFTLGVQKTNPDAVVKVVWTNTWYDPVVEREAAVALLDAGADVIAQHQDTTEPQKAAAERDVWSIGYHSDMAKFVGDSVLVSAMWEFSHYYTTRIQAAMDGTWKTQSYWGGLADGDVKLSDFSPLVPAEIKDLVMAEQSKIESGEWDVFNGPVYDQSGAAVIADGAVPSDGDLANMSWFVKGVEGSVNQ
ncbi:MAG: BMP family ABC transporter substrate-binding protein [Spirochaetales bacterium]|uniref:BMP family ABC transporter substrate-binding protein n=1 Tax=Candidatus Thalassospirochaeta sargassi TaxID=3119039 RepID=A0AAJ1MPL9_9SPIO|nr:BMP family ABC transporter substrate-binding protein [Spirochaetales bacterium]